ncbi:ATP-binding protein [Oerskovia jenensis]|uniref:ATP-binding protein n=1 Tax=Oerskovia jenensis TaxID=162169 RepID=UPI0036DE826D
MDLNARITAKLDVGIDAYTFERCALALMANHYGTVIPIEGGSDGGRDGDIVAPIADDPDSRGRILVTTGDSLSNLRSSHETWKKAWASGADFRIDQLVMVTSKSLSDAKRRNIETYCADHGLPVPHIYSRQWLVDSLRSNPELRVELTGVKGRLEALTTKAPAVASTRLVGRDEELERLRTAMARKADVSLSGVPGVGKSRLLSELQGSIHFVDGLARMHLFDDLLAMDPSVVVLDDAHLNLELLEDLVRIRSMEQLGFTIVAVTWPGTQARVEALLNEPTMLEVPRLARADLDQVIQALGVHGFRARGLVLEQSDGRAGWAVTLSRLVVDGAGEDLATGQSLLDQVSRLAVAIAGSAVLNEAMACIAVLGEATLEDMEVIAGHAGVPYADLNSWLEATAQGGLVERVNDRWSVLAPIRSLIVASTFFGARRRRSWASFAVRFPDDERLDRSVLEVASRIQDPAARALADAWFAKVSMGKPDDVPLSLVEVYGRIDERAADRAAELAGAVLKAPRSPGLIFGDVVYDPVGTAATGVLRAAFHSTCSRTAARGLLDLAIDDDRPRHQHSEHPMRIIQEMAHYLDPDYGPLDGLRGRILTYTLEWFDEKPDEARWRLLAEVARYVFDPSVEGNWSDPARHLAITMSRGVMTPTAMDSLIGLWDEIDSRATGDAGGKIPHRATAEFCGIFETWCSLSAGVTGAGVAAVMEHREHGLKGAERVLGTLKVLAESFPAVPIRVNRQLDLVSMWNGGDLPLEKLPIGDDRVARFVGVREPHDDIDAWIADHEERQLSLVRELAKLPSAEGVAEYQRLEVEASVLQDHYEGGTFARALSEHVKDSSEWLEAAIQARARPLVAPFVAKARVDGIEIGDQIMSALKLPELRSSVLRAVIREEGDLDDLAHAVIKGLDADDVLVIDDLWTQESATPILGELLVHECAAVRSLAAVSFGEGMSHGPRLPDALRSAWRVALIEAVPGQLPQHSRWRLSEMLKYAVTADPELGADWFIANAAAPALTLRARGPVASFAGLLRGLPRAQKRRIVTTLGMETLISSGFAGDVLGTDADLAKDLLAKGVVDESALLRSMSGDRDHTIEALAPALVAAQVSPHRILDVVLARRGWTGKESNAILKDLEYFAMLSERRPELAELCAVAAEQLDRELESARLKEEQDRRSGW